MLNNVVKNISKDELLNGIAEMFYNKNFGVKTKSDVELFLFKLYFDAASKLSTKNGILDENLVSDYKIGRELGIPPSRVKNLRLKMELQYSRDYDWCKELRIVLCNNKNLTKDNGFVKINIRSKNLLNAVRDWVEDHGGIVEITFNNNEFKIAECDMLNLIVNILPQKDADSLIKNFSEQTKKSIETIKKDGFDIAKICSEIGVNISEVILNLSEAFSPQSQVCKILKSIKSLF